MCNEGQSLNPCWFLSQLPHSQGALQPLLPTGTTSARCCHSPNCELGTNILIVLLFRQSIALDVIPFPKNGRIWSRKISCWGFGDLFFPVNMGRKSPNAASRLCHRLTEAGARQTHRHIVLESAISFPFFPLIPLRKGQGKAPLENKLVSQKRGSSADGSVVLHSCAALEHSSPHPQPVRCPDVLLFQTPGRGKVASHPLSPKNSC